MSKLGDYVPELKVYGWIEAASLAMREIVEECSGRRPQQVRAICAVASIAELRRVAGLTAAVVNHSVSETGNERELLAARADPRRVLVRGIDEHDGEYIPRDLPTEEA